jgi:hypothetical protein
MEGSIASAFLSGNALGALALGGLGVFWVFKLVIGYLGPLKRGAKPDGASVAKKITKDVYEARLIEELKELGSAIKFSNGELTEAVTRLHLELSNFTVVQKTQGDVLNSLLKGQEKIIKQLEET